MFDSNAILTRLGLTSATGSQVLTSFNPSTGQPIASVRLATTSDYEQAIANSTAAFAKWRLVPAPQRGLIVREIAEALRASKEDLGALVSLEMGKIYQEGLGEVQEMIDVADFALGLSRQLYGMTTNSERPGHRLYEQWHPLGPVGVITAFNFPVAVWAWNALIAAVCGDTVIWKPSEETPLTAIAVHNIASAVLRKHNFEGVFELLVGDVATVGEPMLDDRRLPLISATGSTRMGKIVAERVGRRLGRTLLELGGNNAIILMPDADLDLALRGCLFAAVGTAGQRCTTLRRLFLHSSIAETFRAKLTRAYSQIRIGDPLLETTLMGPLINQRAVQSFEKAVEKIRTEGGEILYGGNRWEGNFVEPTIARSRHDMAIVQEEVFAPILHTIDFDHLDDAIAWNNEVPQGLSSSIFTTNLKSAEAFLSARGSDCGIANVNIGTSGAEIGGAFGGEKETGGGRESGSDSWKAYMRRQTVTINYSDALPLAQGIEFNFD
ncbi:MAG: aldehyde dehydrogenase family protein [Acidobacteria bacterium]|nr:aldehyde dehydrogenase family protein [Acidobacteriota bacterium]